MDNKERFTNKVSNYAKYRPTYPAAFIGYLLNEVGLSGSVVADVGAGTGILTRLLAPQVKRIYAVEPNFNMRSACEEYCGGYESFEAVCGSAEETGLPGASADYITVAQAFHWFDRQKAKAEFQRVLVKNGRAVLVWNHRAAENEFIRESDGLFRRMCPGFNGFSGGSGTVPEEYSDFFRDGKCEYRVFDNDRLLTLEEYTGSSLSSSYAPLESDRNYGEFVDGLKALFEKYSTGGRLIIPNKTHSYAGLL